MMTIGAPTVARLDDERLGKVIRLIGHAIRNKLGVIKNSTFYLRMKVGGSDPKVDRHLDILEAEIAQSNRTLVNLMDWASPKPPRRAPENIAELVDGVASVAAPPDGVDLHVQLADNLPDAYVDREQVSRAIENVLHYQLSTLFSGDTLRVQCGCSDGLCVDCIDSGPGHSLRELSALFDPERSDGLSPLHLGLAIARRLATLNGGQLQVESRRGIGTRFSLMLPSTGGGTVTNRNGNGRHH